MYSSFWDNLKNAFSRRDNSLYKLMAINLIAFFILLISRVVLTLSGFGEVYKEGLKWIMMPASLPTLAKQPWSIFTYFFLHEGLFHILSNLLFLYYFGLLIHQYLGSRKLTNLYILGGVFGAGFYVLMYNIAPYFSGAVDTSFMLGASAGVFLKILTKTWARDSHGLFDYEANSTKNNLLLINGRYKIVRKKNDVRQMTENTELDMEDRELAKVKFDGGKTNLYI
jgi:hypothetical protein